VRATVKSTRAMGSVLGCFLNARTDTDEVDCPALGDNPIIGRSSARSSRRLMNAHAAFDAGPGNDAVAYRGVRIAEEDKRVLDQNREIDPATP